MSASFNKTNVRRATAASVTEDKAADNPEPGRHGGPSNPINIDSDSDECIVNGTSIKQSAGQKRKQQTSKGQRMSTTTVKRAKGPQAHDLEQRATKNAQRNEGRRDQRLDPTSTTAQTRARQKEEHRKDNAPAILETLTDEWGRRVDRWTAVQATLSLERDPLEVVKALVKVSRSMDGYISVDDNIELWNIICPVAPFLVATARDPFHLDPAPFLSSGVLSMEDDRSEDLLTVKYYVRHGKCDDLVAVYKAYLLKYPVEIPQTALDLLILGLTPDELEPLITESLAFRGYASIVPDFMDAIRTAAGSIPKLSSNWTHPSVLYMGMSAATSATKRLEQDLLDTQRRFSNLARVADECGSPFHWTVYRIVDLECSCDGPFALRRRPLYSFIEATIIHCLSGRGLNQAHGGCLPDWEADSVVTNAVAEALTMVDDLELGERKPTATIDAILGYFEDERALMALSDIGDQQIDDSAFEELKQNAAACLRTVNDAVVHVVVCKDTPAEAFDGRVGGLHHETIGRGMKENRYTAHMLNCSIPLDGSLSPAQIADFFGAIIDLWRLSLRHRHIWIVALFLSRYLIATRPRVIHTQSSRVASLVASGAMAEAAGLYGHKEDFAAFLAGSTNLTCLRALHDIPDVREYRGNQFSDMEGQIVIRQYGPEPYHLCLHIAHRDPGQFKYWPLLSHPYAISFFLSNAIGQVVSRVTAARLASGDICNALDSEELRIWLRGTKETAEAILSQSGLAQVFADHKRGLRKAERAFMSLMLNIRPASAETSAIQVRAAKNRRAHIKAAHGCEARELQFELYAAKAQWNIENGWPADPDQIIPFQFVAADGSILFDEWRTWFLDREDGINLTASAQSYGRTEAKYASSACNKAALGQWRHANKRTNDQIHAGYVKLLRTALIAISETDWVSSVKRTLRAANASEYADNLETRDVWRACVCPDCDGLVVGKDQNSGHVCIGAVELRTVTDTNFPALSRLLYPHDILGTALEAFLGSDAREGFCVFDASTILTSALRDRLIPRTKYGHITGKVFVADQHILNAQEHLVLAFDIAISELSTCPSDYQPKSCNLRYKTWSNSNKTQEKILKVLAGQSHETLFIRCCGRNWASVIVAPSRKQLSAAFQHKCDAWDEERIQNCGEQLAPIQVVEFLGLPPDVARRAWFYMHRQSRATEANFQLWKA